IEPEQPTTPAGAPGAAGAQQPVGVDSPTTGEPAAGGVIPPAAGATPANLILAEEAISLATGFDANRWDVQPDEQSVLHYAVTDKSTGKRIGGYTAYQVIQSYEKQGQAEAKKSQHAAESAAKKQQRLAEAAAKKAA